MIDEEEKGLLWLYACTDLDDQTRVKLLRAAKNPKNLFFAFESYAKTLIKEENSFPTFVQRQERVDDFLAQLEKKGYFFITPMSADYPKELKVMRDPPVVLYGAGRRELLKNRKFCVVGSRITPPHAEKLGESFARTLSAKFTIVTGIAEGGDRAAIGGAFPNVICVLPNGLDECYPAAHTALKEKIAREGGLLLSEYLPQEKVRKYSFFARNRVLAGLSEGVLVLSAGKRSGALITANRAIDYGREVFALPYNVGVSQGIGCNELIKQGAYCCTEAEDILSAYGLAAEEKREAALTEEEKRVLDVLREEGELHAAVIAERMGVKAYELMPSLSSLEIKGFAVKSGGNRYSAVK